MTTHPTKKVKVSSHVDQLDDSECDLISASDLDQAYRNYREVTGSDPQPEADPTAEQVTILLSRIVQRNESPYADFSVQGSKTDEIKISIASNRRLMENGRSAGPSVV